MLRKADLQRAAAGERKRPAGRRVVEQRERPAADGTADNRPAVEERQRTNTGVVLMALPFRNSTVLPLATV